MSLAQRLKQLGKTFKREIRVYKLLAKDARVPRPAKWLLAMAIGYVFSPIDMFIDSIPGLGFIDDIIIVPTLVFLALRLIPPELIDEYRTKVERDTQSNAGGA